MNRNFAPENGGAATRNQEEKRELQKKVHGKICVRDITFLATRPLSCVIFVAFSVYSC